MHDAIKGLAVRGDGRGRSLGFPTANMDITELALEEGIWAAWCRLEDDLSWRQGALHVGPRPTYRDTQLRVELHILDFPDRDLYGESIVFVPVERIRGVKSFSSEGALVDAITEDCREVRTVLLEPPALRV